MKFIDTGSTPLSNKVGETYGGKNIAGMWKGNYSNVFNYVANTCDKAEVEEYIFSEVGVESINVCLSEIVEEIKYLPHNKSPGHDSLMSEHFQYAYHILLYCTIIKRNMEFKPSLGHRRF